MKVKICDVCLANGKATVATMKLGKVLDLCKEHGKGRTYKNSEISEISQRAYEGLAKIYGISPEPPTKDLADYHTADSSTLDDYDRKMIAQGFVWKASLWIHPKQGGDDYQKDIYFQRQPTNREIKGKLRNSAIKDNYRVLKLGV